MATQQANSLVQATVSDVNKLVTRLLESGADIDVIYQRYTAAVAYNPTILDEYVWPDGYTKTDFSALVTVLNALAQMIVTDSARNAMFKLIQSIV